MITRRGHAQRDRGIHRGLDIDTIQACTADLIGSVAERATQCVMYTLSCASAGTGGGPILAPVAVQGCRIESAPHIVPSTGS